MDNIIGYIQSFFDRPGNDETGVGNYIINNCFCVFKVFLISFPFFLLTCLFVRCYYLLLLIVLWMLLMFFFCVLDFCFFFYVSWLLFDFLCFFFIIFYIRLFRLFFFVALFINLKFTGKKNSPAKNCGLAKMEIVTFGFWMNENDCILAFKSTYR